jgi:hypothetical protein
MVHSHFLYLYLYLLRTPYLYPYSVVLVALTVFDHLVVGDNDSFGLRMSLVLEFPWVRGRDWN